MSDLLEECPDALEWCRSITDNLQPHLLYPEERFTRLSHAVLSSTSIDTQGEAFSLEALEHLVSRVEVEPFWMLFNHDPTIHPVGRVVAARLFFSEQSQTWFVAGVTGAYDPRILRPLSELEEVANTHVEANSPLSGPPPDIEISIAASPHEMDLADLSALPSEVDGLRFQRAIRKGLDPISMVTITLSLLLLSQTPFIKKFQERLGEAAADEALSLLGWLKARLILPIFTKAKRRTLLEFVSEYKGCRVQFVIDSDSCSDVAAAVDAAPLAARHAECLVTNLESLGPQKLVYLYDSEVGRWFPLHAATRHGVFTDRPTLIAMEQYAGLSLGGVDTRQLAPSSQQMQSDHDS